MRLPGTAHMSRSLAHPRVSPVERPRAKRVPVGSGSRAQRRPASRGSGRPGSMPQLPPGQRKADGFPRFGGPFKPPTVPADPALEITGAVREPVTVALSELSALPRTGQTSDFHCVAGWSAIGLRWGGVGFTTFYRSIIEPQLSPATAVTHVVFCGLDGYRAAVSIEDALQEDVLLADRLDDEPLSLAHGAPLRLVSPQQYGYLNAKHLRAIEIHTSAPPIPYPAVHVAQRSGQLALAHLPPRSDGGVILRAGDKRTLHSGQDSPTTRSSTPLNFPHAWRASASRSSSTLSAVPSGPPASSCSRQAAVALRGHSPGQPARCAVRPTGLTVWSDLAAISPRRRRLEPWLPATPPHSRSPITVMLHGAKRAMRPGDWQPPSLLAVSRCPS